MLERRLDRLVQMFHEDFSFDVAHVEGGGAAGGLGGALAALGGRLVPGVELVADEVGLFDYLDPETEQPPIDLVITGEGRLDRTSFDGKVVGGVASFAADAGVPTAAVVGSADAAVIDDQDVLVDIAVLSNQFGIEAALSEPKRFIEAAVITLLGRRS